MNSVRCFRVGERVWWRNAAGELVSGIFHGIDADAQCWIIPESARSQGAVALDPDLVFHLPNVSRDWKWQ